MERLRAPVCQPGDAQRPRTPWESLVGCRGGVWASLETFG